LARFSILMFGKTNSFIIKQAFKCETFYFNRFIKKQKYYKSQLQIMQQSMILFF
jgi:hypothetical protein